MGALCLELLTSAHCFCLFIQGQSFCMAVETRLANNTALTHLAKEGHGSESLNPLMLLQTKTTSERRPNYGEKKEIAPRKGSRKQ
ncbi:Cystathionine Gamma-Lyase, partial [Manis pentadactyla]